MFGPVTSGFEITHTYAVSGTYTVTVCVADDDGGTGCDAFTLTVDLNGAPIAVDDEDTTTEDTPAGIFVLANDSDPDGDELSITAVTQPEHGAVVINQDVEDTVTYSPLPNFFGSRRSPTPSATPTAARTRRP